VGECLCEFESRSGHHRRETEKISLRRQNATTFCRFFFPWTAEGRQTVAGGREIDLLERASRVKSAYEALLSALGPQNWWPGGGPFEIIAGAVLTQNSAWRNAERALELMRRAGALDSAAVSNLPIDDLEELVRPAGAWRRKARTIAALARAIDADENGLPGFLGRDTQALRMTLLAVRGVGPETADAILLYACGRPVFVVDAYTRRYLERHGIAGSGASYDDIQRFCEHALSGGAMALAECHALMVELGKRYCRPSPLCGECPLRGDLPAS